MNFDKPAAMTHRHVDGVGELDAGVAGLERPIQLLAHNLARRAPLDVDEMRLRQVGHVAVVFDGALSREAAIDEAVCLVECDVLVHQMVVRLEFDELAVLDAFVKVIDRQAVGVCVA